MHLRCATLEDLDSLHVLIRRSAIGLRGDHYTPEQVDAALQGAFGVDTQLVLDGSYFAVLDIDVIVACGGWSYRRTLFGGDAHTERSPKRLDPNTEAAKIRAFFVAPEYARRGLGTMILDACESAAMAAGFKTVELMSTMPGLQFYLSQGFVAGEPKTFLLPGDVEIRFIPMQKTLERSGASR